MKIALQVILVLVAAFLAWAFLRTPSPEEREKSSARRAIELCWQDQGRKSLAPDAARFIAGACEKMETDFVAKYGVKP